LKAIVDAELGEQPLRRHFPRRHHGTQGEIAAEQSSTSNNIGEEDMIHLLDPKAAHRA
jgi:hypothetical protein